MGKLGIKFKLLIRITPCVVIAFITVIAIAYISSKSSIEAKTKNLLKSEAVASANSIEAWAERNLGILSTAVKTMEDLKMNEEEILLYESFFLEKYQDFPYGIYIGDSTGKVYDASGWSPEGSVFDCDWYAEGMSHDTMQFGEPYMDSLTKEFVVTASTHSDCINNTSAVICADVGLSVLKKVITGMKVDGDGDAFIVDTSNGTIIAHNDEELLGKCVDTIEDNFYKDALVLAQNESIDTDIIDSFDGEYMVCTSGIDGTSWVIIARALTGNIYSDVTKLGGVLIGLGIFVSLIIGVIIIFLVQKIVGPIKKLTDSIVCVTDGDFTKTVEVKGNDEVSVMANSMSKFVEVMRGTLATISSISEQIDSQAQDSNEISYNLYESAVGQADAMDDMRQNLEQLVESIEVIAENATNLANMVANANESGTQAISKIKDTMNEADSGRNSMNSLTASMDEMKQDMDLLEKSISEVGQSAVKIDEITETIRSIAEETNLLSLNASIEAARAGEAGKGFSVVAVQIKKLAETSAIAAAEISELISNVVESINATVTRSHESVEQIKTSSEKVYIASEQFNNIYGSIENTNEIIKDMINQIKTVNDVASNMAAITEEQTASAEEIESTAASVQKLADSVSSNSASVADDSKKLAETATHLKEKIAKFTI